MVRIKILEISEFMETFHISKVIVFTDEPYYEPEDYVPGSTGTPTAWLCRYCMIYKPSSGALRLHVLQSRNTPCSKKNAKGKGRPNFYDYQNVKKYTCRKPECGSMFKSLVNLKSHMATIHRYSTKTDSESLDLAGSKKAREHNKRMEAKKAKQEKVQEERHPSKKRRVSKKNPQKVSYDFSHNFWKCFIHTHKIHMIFLLSNQFGTFSNYH